MQAKTPTLNKLVSLTFDEDPNVRKQAAKSLGELDDPAALFALVELSYDKDVGVKKVAQDILDLKKKDKEEVMSFAEIFSSKDDGEEEKTEEEKLSKKDKVLRPITKIFEKKLGKEKAERLKSRMMPAIEKIYQKSVSSKPKTDVEGKNAMQEFLTSYLEAVSDISGNGAPADPDPEFAVHEELAGELDSVGTKEKRFELVSREIAEIEAVEQVEQKQEEDLEKLPDTAFKKAYETMMVSGGDDEIMKREMKRMMRNAEKDIKLAYNLAKKKFKETKITHLTKIKDGMRNINTEDLDVRDVENMEYQKTKKTTDVVTRIMINDDEGNEGIIYLFDGRGSAIRPGMKIKVVKGYVKSFDFSGETAITISKKGNVYIVL
jgi:hypothetical protein